MHFADDHEIQYLVTDSRKIVASPRSLFFAIRGPRNDGHDHITEVYKQGVRSFVVEREIKPDAYPLASFVKVSSSVRALQQLAVWHRKKFTYPVVGITGSNGKTIVKEWLYQMLSNDYSCVKNPGSYNSQIGVPLSVWQMDSQHSMAIFEAGISRPGEMEFLQPIIQPSIGLITNIGSAHDEGFTSRGQKIKEKLNLFSGCPVLIYPTDYPDILPAINEMKVPALKIIGWGQNPSSDALLRFSNDQTVLISGVFGERSFELPFEDKASRENLMSCIITLLHLGYSTASIQEKIRDLRAIPMRLQLKAGINQCQIVDDTYNNDLGGLRIGLEFLDSLNQPKKVVILSDILQSGLTQEQLSKQVAKLLSEKSIQKFIGIGFGFYSQPQWFDELSSKKSFYLTTDDFLTDVDWNDFSNEAILVKGARVFAFEKIIQRLQKKIHGTVMEIDLSAMVHNLNYFKSLLNPGVKLMVMVKALAYGSGSNEIASMLQYHRADYLGVAYPDEGVTLRDNHIKLPIMVMNPSEESFDALLERDLEPEIYSLKILHAWVDFLNGRPGKIHLKIDTGMHRLGFEPEELDRVIDLLSKNSNVKVVSVFSHLAGADEEIHDEFTRAQAKRFKDAVEKLCEELKISPIKHLLNTSGILRHPDCQFDMVRLGIGLYGIDPSEAFADKLRPVASLKTVVSQVKRIKKGDSVGYGRVGRAESATTIATLAIGYADGYPRSLGKGVGEIVIRGHAAPVIGNVCMDMTMVDVTHIQGVAEGDEAVVFGYQLPIQKVAAMAQTIPYEILTNTSERVKRVFYAEGI